MSKFAHVAFFDANTKLNGAAFLREVVAAFPYRLHTVLTDIPGGGVASILVNNTNSQNVVRIRGLEIESFGTPIAVVGNETTLHVERCVLAPLSGGAGLYGVDFRPGGTLVTRLFVSDTIISRQVGARDAAGIRIQSADSAGVSAVLDNVRIEDLGNGVTVDGRNTTGANSVTIRNSVVSGSSGFGVRAVDAGSGATTIVLEQTTVSSNATHGIVAVGANSTVRLGNSVVTGNARGLIVSLSGKIVSQGGNVVSGNTVDGAFSSTVAQK